MIESDEKKVEKKVITLLLESNRTFFLSVQYAYSLEDAFVMAKLEFDRLNPESKGTNSLEGAKIGLFSIKTIHEFASGKKEIISADNSIQSLNERSVKIGELGEDDFFGLMDALQKEAPSLKTSGFKTPRKPIEILTAKELSEKDFTKEKKNKLMGDIIKRKDRTMFERNKDLFTKDEIKYIQEKIK